MANWNNDCEVDQAEWERRAHLSNQRYLRALVKFAKRLRDPAPKKIKPIEVFAPEELISIITSVGEKHRVSLRQMRGTCRRRHLVNARKAASIVARANGWSFPEIGRALNRDHTTIMHHVGALRA